MNNEIWGTSVARGMLESLPALIWVKDTRNNIVQCSELVASTLGRSVEEIEGRSIGEICPEEAVAYFADDLEVIRTGRPKRRIIEPCEVASGEKIWLRTDKTPTFDANGSVVGIVAVCFDISNELQGELDRARLALELDRAQHTIRSRDEFLSMAVHELRAPLTPMSLKIQALEGSLSKGPAPAIDSHEGQLHRTLRSLSRHVETLAKRVEDLFGASRLSDGTLVLAREKVDFGQLVRDVLDRFVEQAALARCALSFAESEPAIGFWDPSRIEQIVTNLLTNALKYGAGRPVEVGVRALGRTAVLSVRDHGIGIDAQDHGRIFDKFERTLAAGAFGGLGVGLFIARSIAEAHGGRITVESDVGHGAEFIVELPLAPP